MSRTRSLVRVLSLAILPALRAQDVVITEIHYDPPDETKLEEFIELFNAGGTAADLSGWYFSEGVFYTVPDGTTLGPGQYLVVAESPESIKAKFEVERVLGPYEGHLANDGERLTLRDARGLKVDEVDYDVGFPWPVAPAGDGSSMELLGPTLDNDLGGSWRASGGSKELPAEAVILFLRESPDWHYRKGTSEASDPPSAWRQVDFVEDGTWLVGQTSIGFGDDDDKTVLDDMINAYTSVYLRRRFVVPAGGGIPPSVRLRLYVDDGCIVWINGLEVARSHVAPGDKAYNGVGRSNEGRWEDFLVSNARAFLAEGENLIAIHALNVNLSSNDFSIDAELLIPARSELPPAPTPGAENSVSAPNAPPQVRQVDHEPLEPRSGEAIRITAKVTDPDGVASVSLRYQVVLPGNYIPAFLAHEPALLMARPDDPPPPNPEFENPANWVEIPMADDGKAPDAIAGDGVFSAAVAAQVNRTLLRYRVSAADRAGAPVLVPHPDDPTLNFALFVHDGVPPYVATQRSVHPEGPGHVYPLEVMTSLPVYFLITRATEIARSIGYNGAWQIPKSNEKARDVFNWEGAFVYEGRVYDHIHYRLRQANDRYGGGGKRSWRFRFNKGDYFRARDNHGNLYPTPWRTLNTGKMFDNKAVGNFGLTETLNDMLWNMVGVPAPWMHTFHFRVVDGVDEVPAGPTGQYYGDFWGMALAIEDYDPRFLDAHGLADGNLYKLKDAIFDGNQLRRNQGRYSITTDADFQNIRQTLRPARDQAWLDANVRYDRWYPYHAIVEAVRHYDFVPADTHSKNRAWFFEPAEGSPYGRLWTLPWDHDASWGPNWNDGIDYSKNAIFSPPGKPELRKQYRSVLREVRDLLWTEETINGLIDDLAAIAGEFARADRDRWRQAPPDAGSQDFGTMEAKVADMKKFAFVSWTGGSGPTVPAGGRAKHLENLASVEGDATSIPNTPVVTAVGPGHFPADGLVFEATPFSDPQGDAFLAMKWRLGEVEAPGAARDRSRARIVEWNTVWQSEELAAFTARITIPPSAVVPGHTYRVRVKMEDATARWSHWSAPVELTVSPPDSPLPALQALRVTEIMYHPAESGDLEFVELQNIGSTPLDLGEVRFREGIQFSFAASDVTVLGPGELVVVVKNLTLFASLYGTGMNIAGEYEGKFDNEGDEIVLGLGERLEVQRFTFDDVWYEETDGRGYSLVINDAVSGLERWSLKEGWRASGAILGTPGEPDSSEPPGGLQLPGDLSQDAALDITDAVVVLGHLFKGDPARLPCASGSFQDPANRALADLNGDGSLNLTDAIAILRYLFQGEAPPALGTSCIRLVGCPEICVE